MVTGLSAHPPLYQDPRPSPGDLVESRKEGEPLRIGIIETGMPDGSGLDRGPRR